MLLAVDIGNTSIHGGVFKGRVLRKSFRIPTYSRDLRSEFLRKIRPYLKGIDCAVIVSVVAPVLSKLERVLRDILHKKIFVVGRDVDSGVKNLYTKPKQVGQDRLVNARAAYELYKGSSIIVDFGTAITIDIINKHKEYIGGVIAPGIEISMAALSDRAYLLPRVTIEKPKGVLGKETRQSMLSGAVYGFSSLCDGLVQRLKKGYCRNSRVIATGGLCEFIGPYCRTIDKIDPDLTLKGLRLILDNV